jgi:predicted DNA-binding protein
MPRKPKSDTEPHTRTLRLPPELFERLRLFAFNQRRPQNDIIVEALEDWLNKHEAEDKAAS